VSCDPQAILKSAAGTETWGSSYRLIAAEKWRAKSAAMGRPLTEALVEYVQPRPGMQVLDLASGTGEPAISLAARIGPQGHVTALDLSADLLEIARNRARHRGLRNISFHQADAHHLPFPDNSFDQATSRFGVMFFADAPRALRELHRVLRPQARCGFAAWGPFEQPYWKTTMGIVCKHVGGVPIPPGAQDPLLFCRAGQFVGRPPVRRIPASHRRNAPRSLVLAGRTFGSVGICAVGLGPVSPTAGTCARGPVAPDQRRNSGCPSSLRPA
jgi:SAM-dependent methyltransferase